jgi:predicted nuclease of predicted toxin-antitoxin system
VIRFLIDEDVTPRLRDVANERGYEAHHVQYLDWKGRKDFAIRRRMLDEDLTLVTGNWKDFRPMLQREEVHPGAISLPDVPRAEQIRLFGAALDHIESADPPLDMVNCVLVVDESGEVEVIPIP